MTAAAFDLNDLRTRPGSGCTVAAGVLFVLTVAYVLLNPQASEAEERATISSPRTPWSSRSANQSRRWFAYQTSLVHDAATYKSGKSSRLVLMGDSITEAWRGTSYGSPTRRADGVPAVLNETLARQWPPKPLALAISGDQTQHVLWRVANGELNEAMATDPQLLVSLLIGTNNLGKGHLPEEAHAGVVAVARLLLERTRGKLLVNALLPRGDGRSLLPALCPPRCAKGGKPFKSFMPAVRKVNALLAASTASLAREFPGRVGYVDCGGPFLVSGAQAGGGGGGEVEEEEVPIELMPDRLHPNAMGHRLMAKCLGNALRRLDEGIS